MYYIVTYSFSSESTHATVPPYKYVRYSSIYSVRKLLTGLARAALMAWKLTVTTAISIDIKPDEINTHHCISIL